MPIASPPEAPALSSRAKGKQERQLRQATLLELRRNPGKAKIKKKAPRLWKFPVTIQTECDDTPFEVGRLSGAARDVEVTVQDVDQVEAAKKALDYIKDKLRPGEYLYGLKVGDRQ